MAAGLVYFNVVVGADGDDLASSYVGCRLIATGQQAHLYAHDPRNFAAIGPDDPWQEAADRGGYTAFLHPYVQTPLWGYALVPICRHTSWPEFQWIFASLALLSFAALVYVVARCWAPALLHPAWLACVLLAVWFFTPFQYSMRLMQTHVFFVLATVAAVLLANRRRPLVAGLLLALAATVKITPGVLVIYWLVRRQWRAALSAAAWSAVLWLLTRLIAGPQLMATYSATLQWISHTLLPAMNNQSLAAWWMDFSIQVKFDSFRPLPLPSGLRLVCSGLLVLTAVLGGWLDRRHNDRSGVAPMGALVTMVGATAFAPIEWTHYSIVLIVPLMVFAQYARPQRAPWLWGVMAAIVLLNLPPLAQDPFALQMGRFAILRSHFYSEVICLVALIVVAVRLRLRRRMEPCSRRCPPCGRRSGQ